ncbi:hypothetical protein OIU74_019130 [Salix koriyanagi]|uniref:Uncharacterized protein n=1 Tax=Salix koriyanagi TaxID=2511006 RepID=A0A9Q0WTA6_9ROSI|nr:hypothetical protein OIU74_019130 [Salix koriyanagi]
MHVVSYLLLSGNSSRVLAKLHLQETISELHGAGLFVDVCNLVVIYGAVLSLGIKSNYIFQCHCRMSTALFEGCGVIRSESHGWVPEAFIAQVLLLSGPVGRNMSLLFYV